MEQQRQAALGVIPFDYAFGEAKTNEAKKRALQAVLRELAARSAHRAYLLLSLNSSRTISYEELNEALVEGYEVGLVVNPTMDLVILPPFQPAGADASDYRPSTHLSDISSLIAHSIAEEELARVNRIRASSGLHELQFHAVTATSTPSNDLHITSLTQVATRGFKTHAEAVVGGTFDRLHPGHKLMLTACAVITEKRLEMGITGEEMLKNKKFASYIQSYIERRDIAVRFMSDINPGISYEPFSLADPYGNTRTSTHMTAIIVSEEAPVLAAAHSINKQRTEDNNVPALDIITVPLVKGPADIQGNDTKLSSTALRQQAAAAADATSS